MADAPGIDELSAIDPYAGIDARIDGGLGRITLQRPGALNALTTEMVVGIEAALADWDGLGLRAIVIDSSSRHFCAGGDVRRVRSLALEARWDEVEAFFRLEYRMNRRIAMTRTPIVSLIDGVCLGGGMGVAIHGHFRVMTDRASMAMPETAIGFIPDVGGSHFLSRLPGAVGQFLGLTGARIGAEDALALGLATHLVPAGRLAALPAALAATDDPITTVLSRYAGHGGHPDAVGRPPRLPSFSDITSVFDAENVVAIRARLAATDADWSRTAVADLDRASPRSLAATHDLIARGRERTLEECLEAEFEVGMRLIRDGDFVEGVRARLVDKDESPAWLR